LIKDKYELVDELLFYVEDLRPRALLSNKLPLSSTESSKKA
jgi:hypothetical protein